MRTSRRSFRALALAHSQSQPLQACFLSLSHFAICREDREHAGLVRGGGRGLGEWQGGVRAGVLWS